MISARAKSPKIQQISHYLLLGVLLTLPFERIPSLSIGPADTTVRISQILILILLMLNVPALWRKRSTLLRAPWIFLVLFNILSFVSALLSRYPQNSLRVAAFILFSSLTAFVVSEVFNSNHLKKYLLFGLIGVVISCVIALYQFFGDLAGLPGWATGLRDTYMKGGIFPFPRIHSTALEPLYYANYLLVPLAVLLLIQQFIRPRVWPISLLVLVIITLSLSRGAQVAAFFIVVGAACAGVLARQSRAAAGVAVVSLSAVVISLGMIGFGSYLYPEYNGQRNSVERSVDEFADQATNINQGSSARGRALARRMAFSASREHPLLGIGPGNFGLYANETSPQVFRSKETIVNNEPLEIAAEQGYPGLLLMLLFGGFLLKKAHRGYSISNSTVIRVAVGGLVLGLLGICLQYQLFSTLYITHIWVAIGLLMGISSGADNLLYFKKGEQRRTEEL